MIFKCKFATTSLVDFLVSVYIIFIYRSDDDKHKMSAHSRKSRKKYKAQTPEERYTKLFNGDVKPLCLLT